MDGSEASAAWSKWAADVYLRVAHIQEVDEWTLNYINDVAAEEKDAWHQMSKSKISSRVNVPHRRPSWWSRF